MRHFRGAVCVGRSATLDEGSLSAARRIASLVLTGPDHEPSRAGRPGAWRNREERCRHGFLFPICETCHQYRSEWQRRRGPAPTDTDHLLMVVDDYQRDHGHGPTQADILAAAGRSGLTVLRSAVARRSLERETDGTYSVATRGRRMLARLGWRE